MNKNKSHKVTPLLEFAYTGYAFTEQFKMQAESNMIIQGERPQSHIVATQSVKLHILQTTTKPEEVIKNIDCSRRRWRSHDSATHSREAGLQDCSDASAGQH